MSSLKCNENDLAHRLVETTQKATGAPLVFTEGSIYRYSPESGMWAIWPDALVQREILGYHKRAAKVGRYMMEATLAVLRVLVGDKDFFTTAPAGVALGGEFAAFNSGKMQLEKHAPANRSRFGYSALTYSKKEPKALLNFFKDVFEPDSDAHEKTRLLQEFLGGCILGMAPRYEHAIVFYGKTGRNGKSILVEAISRLFPSNVRKAIPPQLWTNEYYARELSAARLNLVAELPKKEILENSAVKAVISGDEITGRNPTERAHHFRPIAGHIFSCNKLPTIVDTDDAFWRRWIVLTFNRTFDGFVSKDSLIQELTVDLPAFVSWALRGAERLLSRGNYAPLESSQTAIAKWRLRADHVALFLDEGTDRLSNGRTSVMHVYEAYKRWCLAQGHNRLSSSGFKERMEYVGIHSKRGDTGYVYPLVLRTNNEGRKP